MTTTKKSKGTTPRFLATIDRLRREIDGLDDRLVALLNQRTTVALSIGRLKRRQGARIYVRSRELAILKRVAKLNRGPLTRASLQRIYRAILAASRQGQRKARIG